jgi:hypothetical protein
VYVVANHVGAWVGGTGWRASRSPGIWLVDMCLEDVTKETVVSVAPDPWLSVWAAHLAEWAQGLGYSSLERLSYRSGSTSRLHQQVVRPGFRMFYGQRAAPNTGQWLGPWVPGGRLLNCPRSPACWPCSCLRAASSLVGRNKFHLHQLRWLDSEPVSHSIHWPFRVVFSAPEKGLGKASVLR